MVSVHGGPVRDGEDDLGSAVGTSSSEVEGTLSAGVDTGIAAKKVRSRYCMARFALLEELVLFLIPDHPRLFPASSGYLEHPTTRGCQWWRELENTHDSLH